MSQLIDEPSENLSIDFLVFNDEDSLQSIYGEKSFFLLPVHVPYRTELAETLVIYSSGHDVSQAF
jgi:hypothetical protein